MNNVYVTSDTHFGHKRVIEFEGKYRPFDTIEEHDAELVRRWNTVVGPKDTVWHLGDVLFGAHSFETLKQLNGRKKLVMGNHDRYPTAKYLEHFSVALGSTEYKGCILTHIPIHESQFRRYKRNIHGHLHSDVIDDSRYCCVSVEHTNLAPVLLNSLI